MEKSQNQNQNHSQETKQKMRKSQDQNPPKSPGTNHKIQRTKQSQNHAVWDCESALYDSFELNSFHRQLNSVIHARTFSMPHSVENRGGPFPPVVTVSKKSSNISRSFRKIFKSVFKKKRKYVFYGESGALTTTPEDPVIDFARLSPEINRFVRRTESEKSFAVPASSIGISCA